MVSLIQSVYAATLVYTAGIAASHGDGPKLTIPTYKKDLKESIRILFHHII
jgi:hypothetical protein